MAPPLPDSALMALLRTFKAAVMELVPAAATLPKLLQAVLISHRFFRHESGSGPASFASFLSEWRRWSNQMRRRLCSTCLCAILDCICSCSSSERMKPRPSFALVPPRPAQPGPCQRSAPAPPPSMVTYHSIPPPSGVHTGEAGPRVTEKQIPDGTPMATAPSQT